MTLMKSGTDYEYDEPQMDRKVIELLWDEFGDCNRDDDDRIDSSWCGWERGTDVHEIWHWFDAQYAQWGGVHALMFPDEHKKSEFGSVKASVSLQQWMNDYAITFDTVEFDCGKALDMLPIERVEKLVSGESDYDTDEVFAYAVSMGLVEDHDGPFDCYICDQDELEAYTEARKESE